MNTTLNSENTPTPTSQECCAAPTTHRSGGMLAGGILIVIGLMALVQNIPGFEWGLYFLPALATVFLAAGLVGRKAGLLIPGGILMGVGAGAILESGLPMATEMAHGGVFFLALAGGFALISLAGLVIGKHIVWPVFPAAGTAFFGAVLMMGEPGLRILELSGYFWPLVLIAVGAYLILRRR